MLFLSFLETLTFFKFSKKLCCDIIDNACEPKFRPTFTLSLTVYNISANFNFLHFLRIFYLFWEFWNFLRILKFSENFENFLRILKFSENFEIFWEFWNFLRILKFSENFEIFWEFGNISTIYTCWCFYTRIQGVTLWELFQQKMFIYVNSFYAFTC